MVKQVVHQHSFTFACPLSFSLNVNYQRFYPKALVPSTGSISVHRSMIRNPAWPVRAHTHVLCAQTILQKIAKYVRVLYYS